MKYYLMNKDTRLVAFSTAERLGTTVFEEQRLTEQLPIGYTDIDLWVKQRNYAKHKEHLQKWLHDWNLETADGFLDITHALSLNDTLWVKQENSSLTWKDVNLYENAFDDITCHTAFDAGLHGLELSSTSPEFTSEGTFPKCWVRKENQIYIYKAGLSGAANLGNEPYGEYLASQIGQELFSNILPYDLIKFKGKICSKSKLFTSEDEGFVPFYKTVPATKNYNIPAILDILMAKGMGESFREMILLDSICFNTDRHMGNFGYIFHNETFEVQSFAPIFDFNYAMLTTLMMDDFSHLQEVLNELHYEHRLSGAFDVVGQEIITPKIREKLPNVIDFTQHEKYKIPEERFQILLDVVNDNYSHILHPNRTQIAVTKDITGNVQEQESWEYE